MFANTMDRFGQGVRPTQQYMANKCPIASHVRLQKDKKYKVTKVVDQHNHAVDEEMFVHYLDQKKQKS